MEYVYQLKNVFDFCFIRQNEIIKDEKKFGGN